MASSDVPTDPLGLPPPPWLVAHRGASGDRLENTLESCLLAVAVGAPMIEIDVQLAADGELVVIHDWDLVRLAGDRRVVEELSARELVTVQLALAAERTGDDEAGAPSPGATLGPLRGVAPTLSALLAALPPAYPLNLELKRRAADRDRFAAAVVAAIERRGGVVVSSFDHELLAALHAASPALPLAPLASEDAEGLVAAGERLGAWGLHCHRRLATRELVRAAREAGRRLLVYTVNSGEDARQLFASGVDGVFTDWAARLMAELAGTVAHPSPAVAAGGEGG